MNDMNRVGFFPSILLFLFGILYRRALAFVFTPVFKKMCVVKIDTEKKVCLYQTGSKKVTMRK